MEHVKIFDGDLSALSDSVRNWRGLLVLMFMNEGCRACMQAKAMLAPVYDENLDVLFLKIEAGDMPDLCSHYKISQVPQFVFVKGLDAAGEPKEVGRQLGWEEKTFRQKITQYI